MEMKKYKLGDLGNVCMCKRILKEQTNTVSGIPFYKIGTFGGTADVYIDRKTFETYKELYNYPKKGDILISAAGTIGRTVIFDGSESYFQDSNIVWINNDESQVLNKYLFYCYKNIKWFTSKGSTILRLYNDNIRNSEIIAPNISDQQKIAAVLSSLDDKIALNNRINAKLEQMAKRLYDYWFVQFDFPGADGKPYKSNGGKMVWNEELKREIPEGWKIKQIKDFCKKGNIKSFDFSEEDRTIDLSVMPSNQMFVNEFNSSKNFTTNLFEMKNGDILFGSIRPYLHKAVLAPCDGVVAGTVHNFRIINSSDYNFIAITLCSGRMFDYANSLSQGTKMPVVSFDSIMNIKFYIVKK